MGPHTRTFGPSKSRRKRLLKLVVRLINARGRKGCILKAGLVFLVLLYSLYGLGYPWVGSLLQVWLGHLKPSANYSHPVQHFFQQIVHSIDVASHSKLQRTERHGILSIINLGFDAVAFIFCCALFVHFLTHTSWVADPDALVVESKHEPCTPTFHTPPHMKMAVQVQIHNAITCFLCSGQRNLS